MCGWGQVTACQNVCVNVCKEKEKLGLTLWSVNQEPLKALVRANFYGPIGGLAQHGRSYSVKVKSSLFLLPSTTISHK